MNTFAHSTMIRLGNGKACFLEAWNGHACKVTLVYENRTFWTNIGNIRDF